MEAPFEQGLCLYVGTDHLLLQRDSVTVGDALLPPPASGVWSGPVLAHDNALRPARFLGGTHSVVGSAEPLLCGGTFSHIQCGESWPERRALALVMNTHTCYEHLHTHAVNR